jgi:hypothetical protein
MEKCFINGIVSDISARRIKMEPYSGYKKTVFMDVLEFACSSFQITMSELYEPDLYQLKFYGTVQYVDENNIVREDYNNLSFENITCMLFDKDVINEDGIYMDNNKLVNIATLKIEIECLRDVTEAPDIIMKTILNKYQNRNLAMGCGEWILKNGVWDDLGIWDDNAVWID